MSTARATGARAAGVSLRAAVMRIAVPGLPPRREGSRGIVTAAGTPRQLLGAWLAVRRLRALGSVLPVEVFHTAVESVPAEVARAFPGDVRFRRLEDASLCGFQIKPFALWHSSFDRCLWIDADNLPLRDPGFVLDGDMPATFWPDAFQTSDAAFLEGFDPGLAPELEFESGQMVVHATACREALWRACLLNGPLRTVAYSYVFGDKDTWRMAFASMTPAPRVVAAVPTIVGERSLELPLGVATLKIRSAAGRRRDLGLLQVGPDGPPLWFHRTVREWDFFDRQPSVAWVQPMTAQRREPRQDLVPDTPVPPSTELVALERWALEAISEAEWFLAACGVSPLRQAAQARSVRLERTLGVAYARISKSIAEASGDSSRTST